MHTRSNLGSNTFHPVSHLEGCQSSFGKKVAQEVGEKDWAHEQAIQGSMVLGDQKAVNPKTRQNMQSKFFK